MIPLRLLLLILIGQQAQAFTWLPTYYDDSYITSHLEDRFAYLKTNSSAFVGPRDYFNFSHVHEPTEEYLEQVNLEQFLYEEIKSMEITSSIATMDQWNYTSEQLELELDGRSNPEKCLAELAFLVDQVRKADKDSDFLFRKGKQNHRTLRLLDTWARPPSETYFGSSYWTGSYRGCKLLEGRYCWAKLRARDWPLDEEIVPPTSIRAGTCLPASCNSRLANAHRDLLLEVMQFNFSPQHRARFNKIAHVYCLPLDRPTSIAGLVFKIVLANWLLVIAVLSLLVAFAGREMLPSFLYNLTLQENYRKLSADDEPPPTNSIVDLRPIGVARFLATVAVCVGHCALTSGWVSKSSTFNIRVSSEPSFALMLPLLKSNDLFWLMGGLLTSYTIMGKFSRKRLNHIFRPTVYAGIIVARYLRLAAIQIIVLAFAKSVYLSMGEGPFWDYGTSKYSLQGQCQATSWWRVLLFPILFAPLGQNYKHECLPVSWHIVADIKLSLVAPALVYLLASRLRWLVMGLVSLISLAAQYNDLTRQQIIYYEQFFKYNQPQAINMLSMAFNESGYFNIYTRLFPLSVGLLAGIYLYEHKQQPALDWPRWMRGSLFWCTMLAYQAYDWLGPALAQYRYSTRGELPTERAIMLALWLKPRVDCIMFGAMLTRLASVGLAPRIMKHARVFYKLGKVSYCVLLVHPMVISYLVSADESSRMDMFFTERLRLMASCVTLSYLISFPLYILFESPLASLTGSLFSSASRSSSRLNELTKRD